MGFRRWTYCFFLIILWIFKIFGNILLIFTYRFAFFLYLILYNRTLFFILRIDWGGLILINLISLVKLFVSILSTNNLNFFTVRCRKISLFVWGRYLISLYTFLLFITIALILKKSQFLSGFFILKLEKDCFGSGIINIQKFRSLHK